MEVTREWVSKPGLLSALRTTQGCSLHHSRSSGYRESLETLGPQDSGGHPFSSYSAHLGYHSIDTPGSRLPHISPRGRERGHMAFFSTHRYNQVSLSFRWRSTRSSQRLSCFLSQVTAGSCPTFMGSPGAWVIPGTPRPLRGGSSQA